MNFEFKGLRKLYQHARRHELDFDMMNQLILEINSMLEVYIRLKIESNVQKSILKFLGEIMVHGALESREDY